MNTAIQPDQPSGLSWSMTPCGFSSPTVYGVTGMHAGEVKPTSRLEQAHAQYRGLDMTRAGSGQPSNPRC